MAKVRRLVELGMTPELAKEIVEAFAAMEARIAELEQLSLNAIVTDDAP